MGTHLRWRVGDVTITRVEECIVELSARALIPDFRPECITPHQRWLVPSFFTDDGLMRLSIHSFVVSSGDTTVVVDTCVGTDPERPLPGRDDFPAVLDDAIDGGLGAVDFVLCTHLHFDHVGWNLRTIDDRRVPTFPSARYLVTQAELEHLDADDHMTVREPSVQPLLEAGVLDAVAMDHRITDEIRLMPTPGHTPGHVSVLIESGGASAVITGDMAHTPLQFAEPALGSANFDADSEQATTTRRTFIGDHVDSDVLVLGTHFAPPTGGRLHSTATGPVFVS